MPFRILFIDDDICKPEEDDFVYEAVRNALEEFGKPDAFVDVARTVAEAVEAINGTSYGAFILDIDIPLGKPEPTGWNRGPRFSNGIGVLQYIIGQSEKANGRRETDEIPPCAIVTGVAITDVIDKIEETISYFEKYKIFFKPVQMREVVSFLLK